MNADQTMAWIAEYVRNNDFPANDIANVDNLALAFKAQRARIRETENDRDTAESKLAEARKPYADKIMALEAEIAELHGICDSKDSIIGALNLEAIETGKELRAALSCLSHLEWGVHEFRRGERNRRGARTLVEIIGGQTARESSYDLG